MTKSTITRERIELIANFHRAMTLPPSHDEIEELARMTLVAMDSEPVAWTWHYLKWFTEFGHLNRGDMLTSEQHRCHNEKKKFQRRV